MRLLPLMVFGALLAAAALLLWVLGMGLPAMVAVHFDGSGSANGYLARAECRNFMLSFTLGAPACVAVATGLIPRLLPPSMINIPNRGYWLAPERARASIDFLSEQGIWFACLFLIFLICIDWMVASANASVPPALSTARLGWAMAAFACAIALWAARMFRRFRIER